MSQYQEEGRAHQKELPYVLLSVGLGALDLGLAVAVEGARLQRRLQLPGALEQLCLRGNLAHKHLSGDGLGALHGSRFGILKGYQLSTKLRKKKNTRSAMKGKNKCCFNTWLEIFYFSLTAKEAPTGLRTHLGGFFKGETMVSCTTG